MFCWFINIRNLSYLSPNVLIIKNAVTLCYVKQLLNMLHKIIQLKNIKSMYDKQINTFIYIFYKIHRLVWLVLFVIDTSYDMFNEPKTILTEFNDDVMNE